MQVICEQCGATYDDAVAHVCDIRESVLAKGGLVLEFEHLLCPLHGEPLRTEWPKGFAKVLCSFFKFLGIKSKAEDPAPWITTNFDFMLKDCEGATSAITAELAKKPFCCRLPTPELLEMYRHCDVGKMSVCSNCKTEGLGTPLHHYTKNYWGRTKKHVIPHLCFYCLLYRLDDCRPKSEGKLPNMKGPML